MRKGGCFVPICAIPLLVVILAAGCGYLRALEDLLRAGDWVSACILLAVLILVAIGVRL